MATGTINAIGPYIIEEDDATDTNVTWHYRKWSNGTVEAWGHYEATVACTSSGYGWYRTAELNYIIPSDVGLLDANYVVVGSKANSNALRLASLYPNSATGMKMYLWANASQTIKAVVNAYVIGKWE